ncbi:DEAD-box ATP-dependent RNA helicase 21 [Cinnamomum micranthum f. kanehirae]|uniref:DEAD-box ATP-dependent RNA helicase 21 n=1 Tax=Cinnamomum micranthum f. kanehirae TaxID=337451 RepID=A0A443NBN6_9MAGN|nr:DEAD-box ATP-dependent RNA helicase 21 [Cinnamomum micranthum f. kanehirae]
MGGEYAVHLAPQSYRKRRIQDPLPHPNDHHSSRAAATRYRMIDMGFEPQVVGVLDAMPCSNLKPENEDEELDEKRVCRTTYMFSATKPPAVERLARKYLRNLVVVTIGTVRTTADLITQHVIMVHELEKMPRLQKMLNELGEKSVIVSVNNRKSADTLSNALDKAGCRVTTLHEGKSQNQMEISLEGFKSKRFTLLVATDVMGRGIDIPDVAHVINYDMPGSIETYTHRIGRTGRAGKTGVATTFLTVHDTQMFYDLEQMFIQSNSTVPPELARHEMSKFKPCHFAQLARNYLKSQLQISLSRVKYCLRDVSAKNLTDLLR